MPGCVRKFTVALARYLYSGDKNTAHKSYRMNTRQNPTIRSRFFLTIAFVFCSAISAATDYRWTPPHQGHVTDVANVLSATDRDRLASMLGRYERETTHQIVVLLVPTLSGESIDSFSLRVANSWRLGQKGIDNGVLVTLAMKEKGIRIELGRAIEKVISNAAAQSIIQESMVPAFRKGDYAGGLQAGLDRLMKEGRKFRAPRNGDVPEARPRTH